MADRTPIEWTDATWNVINGCSVVSPGCTNCYAMRLAGTRFRNHPTRHGLTTDSKAGPVWNGQVRFNEKVLHQPLNWTRPRRIFVCAHGDLFHEAVPDAWIDHVFAVMALSPQHVFQVLTKRPERMRAYLADPEAVHRIYELACDLVVIDGAASGVVLVAPGVDPALAPPGRPVHIGRWPLLNVWLGVSAEDQARADERIPILLNTPAAIRWLSAEPLLGPIDLTEVIDRRTPHAIRRNVIEAREANPAHHQLVGILGPDYPYTRLDWVVAGGESGPGARPMHPDWVHQLRDQCAQANVPFLFKQWGDWAPVCDIDTDALDDKLYHPAPARDPEAIRRPRTEQLVLHRSGECFEGRRFLDNGAYAAGSGAMLMFNIGKKLAGRRLNGRIHDGFPTPGEGRSI